LFRVSDDRQRSELTLEGLLAPAEWAAHAACREHPEVDFYPSVHDRPGERAARVVCNACPVRQACLEAGMDERYGVWGGLTERERLRAARRERAA
jgi:WhiB family redox-sensing transcriptional regulator